MKIVFVLPHMHKLGTAFTASFLGGPLNGKEWLQSKGYDPADGVMQVFDPPIDLSQGQGSSFSCTWDNTRSASTSPRRRSSPDHFDRSADEESRPAVVSPSVRFDRRSYGLAFAIDSPGRRKPNLRMMACPSGD